MSKGDALGHFVYELRLEEVDAGVDRQSQRGLFLETA
jgi:hypothetical protein